MTNVIQPGKNDTDNFMTIHMQTQIRWANSWEENDLPKLTQKEIKGPSSLTTTAELLTCANRRWSAPNFAMCLDTWLPMSIFDTVMPSCKAPTGTALLDKHRSQTSLYEKASTTITDK